MTIRHLMLTILAAASLTGLLAAQPTEPAIAPPPSTRPTVDIAVVNLDDRLSALSPDDATAYFRLGEEVAAEADDFAEMRLAQTLYVLAFELDRAQGGRDGSSIALALADLSRLDREQRWLGALARALDTRYAQTDWSRSDPIEVSDAVAYEAATVLGQIRAGRGSLVRDRLEDPEILALFKRYESLLSPHGEPGALMILRRQAENWPCPECSNRRIVRKANTAPRVDILCHTCRGNPGPVLTSNELIAYLRFESRLLNGIARSWSAQIAADGGAPLRDPDPAELAPTLGVDPGRTIWRDGRWVAPPREP